MTLSLNGRNQKSHDPHRDHFVINPMDREVAENFLGDDTLLEIDKAKRQIAEAVGIREEHIRLEIQMLVLAQI